MTICATPISDLPICSSLQMERRSNGEVFDITLSLQSVVNVEFTIDI